MKPLILITNDDGVAAKGLRVLDEIALKFADVIVMAPEYNASGASHSITSTRPLRVRDVKNSDNLKVYACDGTPADCVKLAVEHFCPRQPDLVLSGINHGSNSSINVLYSGTMAAAIEASALGMTGVGISLLNHNPEADFSGCVLHVEKIIGQLLAHPIPQGIALNINIPRLDADNIKGIHICHAAQARWTDSFERRTDPQGRPYWWLTGKFERIDNDPESDENRLADGYISIVPILPDFTHYPSIDKLRWLEQ